MRSTCASIALALAIAAASAVPSAADADRFWPQWRGPEGTGVSRQAKPPVEWSETRNIRWKREIPGRGASTPVIWGDLLFLSTAVPVGVSDAEAHAARGSTWTSAVRKALRALGCPTESCPSVLHTRPNRGPRIRWTI